jgi:hypothetical protein
MAVYRTLEARVHSTAGLAAVTRESTLCSVRALELARQMTVVGHQQALVKGGFRAFALPVRASDATKRRITRR